MDYTAKEITDWAWKQLDAMHKGGNWPSETALYQEISILADVSRSTIRQFHHGTQPNLSAKTLDAVVSALKTAKRLRAA